MKTVLFISLLAVVAWFGLNQYRDNQGYSAGKSGSYTESVKYSKCTSADGRVIYGQPSAGVKCLKNELIQSEIMLLPSKAVATNNLVGNRSIVTDKYRCDGRQHCSQMTSRAEAVFFTKHCPNTKMDGDHDGVPCENDSRF